MSIKLLTFLLFISSPIWCTPITFVQSGENHSNGNSATTSNFSTPPTVGNYVVMFCSQVVSTSGPAPNGTTMNFSDNFHNTYTVLSLQNDTSAWVFSAIAVAKITASGSTFVATCQNSTGSTVYSATEVGEYTNISANIDSSLTVLYAAGSPHVCGSITTHNPSDLIVSYAITYTNSTTWAITTAPSGFNIRGSDGFGAPGDPNAYLDNILTSPATLSLNFTDNDSASTGSCMAVAVKSADSTGIRILGGVNTPLFM